MHRMQTAHYFGELLPQTNLQPTSLQNTTPIRCRNPVSNLCSVVHNKTGNLWTPCAKMQRPMMLETWNLPTTVLKGPKQGFWGQ